MSSPFLDVDAWAERDAARRVEWARQRATFDALDYPSARLTRLSPSHGWPFESGVESQAFLVRSYPDLFEGVSYVLTGDRADLHPELLGHLKVRRCASGLLRAAAVIRVELGEPTLLHFARHLANGPTSSVALQVVRT